MRKCQTCDKPVAPWKPRQRNERTGALEGPCCAGLTVEVDLSVVAHDSGDGETIYHCPFCGSGNVVARSDGSVECGYCTTAFTVQVQPQHPYTPQTIDGQPYDNPDMPGEVSTPGTAPNEPPPQEGENDSLVFTPPGAQPAFEPPAEKAAMFRTAAGDELPMDAYLRHLAIKHGPRESVIEKIRAENRG